MCFEGYLAATLTTLHTIFFKVRWSSQEYDKAMFPNEKDKQKSDEHTDDNEIPPQFEEFAQMEVPMDVDDLTPEDIVIVGATLETIWQQYASDIMQKVGNPHNHNLAVTSYSHLTQYHHQQLCINDINTLDLHQLFSQIQW